MEKLEQLEKALKEYKELIKNATMGYPEGTVATGNTGQEVNTVAKEEHKDEKEDKKLIEEKMDEHNEKKHGEAKDEDSAMKSEVIKFDNNGQWSI